MSLPEIDARAPASKEPGLRSVLGAHSAPAESLSPDSFGVPRVDCLRVWIVSYSALPICS